MLMDEPRAPVAWWFLHVLRLSSSPPWISYNGVKQISMRTGPPTRNARQMTAAWTRAEFHTAGVPLLRVAMWVNPRDSH